MFGKALEYLHRVERFLHDFTLYWFKTKLVLGITIVVTLILVAIHLFRSYQPEVQRDWETIVEEDTLRILTLNASTSYFSYRGEEMGYEYELARAFAEANGLGIKIIVANNQQDLTHRLLKGEGDIVAYPVPVTHNKKDSLLFCGRSYETHQVLIQREQSKNKMLANVTQLIGKTVHVIEGSRFEERLKNLDQELGGGITIVLDRKDTITTEDLIEQVYLGEVDYTLADSYMAEMNRTFYKNLDISLAVSFPQRLGWAVRSTSPVLARQLNLWFARNGSSDAIKSINKRYFERSKEEILEDELPQSDVQKKSTARADKGSEKNKQSGSKAEKASLVFRARGPQPLMLDREKGVISVYDDYFQKIGAKYAIDWRLLAAIAYEESRFDTAAVSWAGARGIMQLMPRTARIFGCRTTRLHQALPNIEAATRYLLDLKNKLVPQGDKENRIKLALAAYNVGIGHIFDARALALKFDKNPEVWADNVEVTVLMKQNSDYYNDPVCKFGYVNGKSVARFVRRIYERYLLYKEITKSNETVDSGL